MMKKQFILQMLFLLYFITPSYSQTVIVDSIRLPSNYYEMYWLQIPRNYSPLNPPPLLIGCHQYSGTCFEFNGTGFPAVANERGWLALAITGVPPGYNGYTHWWSKRVQQQLDLVLDTVFRAYPFDLQRIYIVGGSMGGAAGMQYHHNHLDPNGYMVAATAGGSGIIDLARRAREQGINYSMRYEFGPLDSLPGINFQYKRNSAVVFWDTTNSLHYNLKWLPTRMSAGVLEPHYIHAMDLDTLYGDQMMRYEVLPAPGGNHGWINLQPDTTVEWLSQQPPVIRYPTFQNIAVDEPRRCYDVEVIAMRSDTNMARAILTADSIWINGRYDLINHSLSILRNIQDVKLHIRNDLPEYNINLRNYDTASVGLSIFLPHSVGQPVISITPPLNHVFYTQTRILRINNIPSNYSGLIQLQFPASNVSSYIQSFLNSFQLFPNPSNNQTTIQFELKSPAVVQLNVYDMLGRKVESIAKQNYMTGQHQISFNHLNISSGTYFIVGRIDQEVIKKSFTILK
ncbi:MAG: T9SS type A sorting domain-containing protein [bacterium]|nr:T9SS type A sorting domain-containing protein [bacterium]